MARFPEAQKRMFGKKFACKNCKTVLKADIMAVTEKRVSCKRCGSSALRTLRKK